MPEPDIIGSFRAKVSTKSIHKAEPDLESGLHNESEARGGNRHKINEDNSEANSYDFLALPTKTVIPKAYQRRHGVRRRKRFQFAKTVPSRRLHGRKHRKMSRGWVDVEDQHEDKAFVGEISPLKPDEKELLKFRDAIGRNYIIPFAVCSTWQGMENFIRSAFENIELSSFDPRVAPLVAKGLYQVVNIEGEIILPQVWESIIKPGLSIQMRFIVPLGPPMMRRPGPPLPPGITKAGGAPPLPIMTRAGGLPPPPPLGPSRQENKQLGPKSGPAPVQFIHVPSVSLNGPSSRSDGHSSLSSLSAPSRDSRATAFRRRMRHYARPRYVDRLTDHEAKELGKHAFTERLQQLYESTVINVEKGSITANLSALQRIVLHDLQKKLVEAAFAFKYQKPRINRTLDDTVRAYVRALKDWEYIKDCARKGKNDPFLVSSENTLDLQLLKEVGKSWRREAKQAEDDLWESEKYLPEKFDADTTLFRKLAEPVDMGKLKMFGGSRTLMNQKEAFEQFLKRISMACIGGAFLIGPMLIMVLHQSLLTTLLTASIGVATFGLIMALFLEKPFDVLSGTAAYAAVLVVFVGTSSGGST